MEELVCLWHPIGGLTMKPSWMRGHGGEVTYGGGVGMRSGAYHIISFFAVAPVLFFSMLESVV